MSRYLHLMLLIGLIVMLSACQNESSMSVSNEGPTYQLGSIAAFAEMVRADVKPLALSAPLPTSEMDELEKAAQDIVKQYEIAIYREPNLIVTDLFAADVTKDKEVLLLYRGTTLQQYQELKADQAKLIQTGQYEGEARKAIARRFGRLLGYPSHRINELLASNTDFRSMEDFGIQAGNVFLYYQDLERATDFYSRTLGLELVSDYGMATIFRLAANSYLILVDAEKGMHTAEEPKTVALALLTDQLAEWYNYLQQQKVPIKYEYKPRTGNAHDGFVAIDPEGYLLEFETFKQHPENERFLPILQQNQVLLPPTEQAHTVPEGLGFYASITWLYYKDLLAMQGFYEEVLGLEMVVDQGWTKIYKVTENNFIGLVDERRGMHSFTEKKAVNVSFFLEDVDGWFDYVQKNELFPLRAMEVSTGPESKYRAFVGFDPEGYFMEFDRFFPHGDNERLLKYLNE